MIERQRILLMFVDRSAGPVPKTNLMKMLFLLREEKPESIGSSFYEFVPYKYGPFSFQAYREISALESSGFLEANELKIPSLVLKRAREEIRKLPERAIHGVESILYRYRGVPLEHLLDDVYDRFPWYASRSELRPREFESEANPVVYTVGYEGRTIDGLLDHLLRSGIQRLIDVRKNAMSRKYGFSGKTIKQLCANVDIEYVHVPSLGIPSSLREDLSSPEAYQRLFDLYESDIIPGVTTSISDVAELCSEKPSALMCYEATSDMCHRGRLASYVAKESSLQVKHL